jgi:hypothetical protein
MAAHAGSAALTVWAIGVEIVIGSYPSRNRRHRLASAHQTIGMDVAYAAGMVAGIDNHCSVADPVATNEVWFSCCVDNYFGTPNFSLQDLISSNGIA